MEFFFGVHTPLESTTGLRSRASVSQGRRRGAEVECVSGNLASGKYRPPDPPRLFRQICNYYSSTGMII